MFVPASIHHFDHFVETLRHLCLQCFKIKLSEDRSAEVLLAVWGYSNRGAFRAAVKTLPPSFVDEECSPQEIDQRMAQQAKVLGQILELYPPDATTLLMLWTPTAAKRKPQKIIMSGMMGEHSTHPEESLNREQLTFANLSTACLACLQKREWGDLGHFSILGIVTVGVLPKEPFWEWLRIAASRDVVAKLNLGLSLIAEPVPFRNLSEGVEILRGLDPDGLTPRMRELRLISLSQFEEGAFGGRKNLKASRKLIEEAADEGTGLGTFKLGMLRIQDGDFLEAERLLKLSAATGLVEAKMSLVRMMFFDQMEWNFKSFKKLLEECAAAGIPDAAELLPFLPNIRAAKEF